MIKSFLNKIKKSILDILLPIECLGCGKEDEWLCKECFKKIKLKDNDECPACKRWSMYGKVHEGCKDETYLNGLIVAVGFKEKIIQDMVHGLKYGLAKKLASPLSDLLINKIKKLDEKEGYLNEIHLLFDTNLILVPIPLHGRRLRWRGFNQAELLARRVAEKFNLVMRPYVLKRVRHKEAQIKLKRDQRLENIKDVFRVSDEWRDKLKSTKVLLVDDVTTSGATLNECAGELKKCGVEEVWGIVLARG